MLHEKQNLLKKIVETIFLTFYGRKKTFNLEIFPDVKKIKGKLLDIIKPFLLNFKESLSKIAVMPAFPAVTCNIFITFRK